MRFRRSATDSVRSIHILAFNAESGDQVYCRPRCLVSARIVSSFSRMCSRISNRSDGKNCLAVGQQRCAFEDNFHMRMLAYQRLFMIYESV